MPQNTNYISYIPQENQNAVQSALDTPNQDSTLKKVHIDTKRLSGGGSDTLGNVDTSFKTIYNDLMLFRKATGSYSDKTTGYDKVFYGMDQPGHYWFKVFFYFENPYADPSDPTASSNLLGTSYVEETYGAGKRLIESSCVNTALRYLYNNKEMTRFKSLVEFIQLLSDISTKSPWYFQSVTGLDQAIERQETGRDFKIEEERKQITIKCLPDAYDNRIGRLLDLYRSVVWSQNLHKWILPANLRKFDMGIYIFNSPIKTISGGRLGVSDNAFDRMLGTSFNEYVSDTEDTGIVNEKFYRLKDIDITGAKYIELHGCEIDYNSSKSVYSELDNAEGNAMEYEIVIKFDTAMEDRYDPVFMRYMGDFVIEDLYQKDTDDQEKIPNAWNFISSEFSEDTDYSKAAAGIQDQQLVNNTNGSYDSTMSLGHLPERGRQRNGVISAKGRGDTEFSEITGSEYIRLGGLLNSIMLGNMNGFSLSRLENITSMDPLTAVTAVGREMRNANLVRKRISDFTDPDRGTRELAGKSFRNRGTDFADQNWSLEGRSFRREEDFSGQEDSIEGKTFRSDTDFTGQEDSIEGKTFRSDTDFTGQEDSIEGKTFRSDTDFADQNWSLEGRSFRREEDFPGQDWDLSGRNIYNGWSVSPSPRP